ncbi:dihydrodipicolinate synthase family protein [Ahrensia kielensis]|uniref:Dihydrodipicolinate synthase family protein n=1 Tax=Ahrensia kielensis TaxID=76980 RepID=A0ABU9TBH4_9HYPH
MQGVIAAVPTAIDASGVPQRVPFIEHCQWALDNGCDGLNILGSTGEANSISNHNRKTIMEWAAADLDVSRLMVGTGTPSLEDTITLTKHADDLGYGIALVLPPYYYKPVSDEGLFAWYAALEQALSGRKIEIYFYNFPQMTGIEIPVSVIAALAESSPKRFTGIKDSSGNLEYCRAVLAVAPALKVFPSSETSLGDADESGFAGCISATVNITAPLCAEVWAERHSPNVQTLKKIGEQRTDITKAGLVPAIKYLVGERSGNRLWQTCLPPFMTTPKATAERLISKLSQN